MDANSVVNSVAVAREVNGYWSEIISALITGIPVFIVVLAGYFFGLRTYFRKREHELIIKRYLEEGLDLLSERINNATEVFFYNHMKADKIINQLKISNKTDLTDLLDNFRTISPYLGPTPVYKLFYLVGDDVFALSIQKFFVYIDSQSKYFDVYFRSLVEMATKVLQAHQEPTTLKQLKEELTEPLRHDLDKQYKELLEYFFILDELQKIASILEKKTTLTWSDLSKFKNRPEIKQSVEIAKRTYAELTRKHIQPKEKQ